MELEIIKESKKEINFTMKGATHTICTLIKEALHNVKGVDAASYKLDHPLVGKPEFIVITDGSIEPKEAIKKAAKSIKSENNKVAKTFAALK